MSENKVMKCPLSGIPCDECGYPSEEDCPIDLLIGALQDIAQALTSEDE